MAKVEHIRVEAGDADQRLDRWFRRHYPGLSHGRLEKLLRTGQVRVDGARVKAAHRLKPGARVRVPPLGEIEARPPAPAPREVSDTDAREMQARVLYRNDDIIAIDKPQGLAVQGGTGTYRHVDAMLDALRFGAAERPRLVHRLDRDTSGVLVVARSAKAAARLARAFRGREVRKLYWALVAGHPPHDEGRIEVPLAKRPGKGGERVFAEEEGRRAVTLFSVVDAVGERAAWLALMPLTGRTHQLRAHCVALGVPIVGDGKYGGADAFLHIEGVGGTLHLHARAVELPGRGGRPLRIQAPLPPHMRESWQALGFDTNADGDPFAEEWSL